ncbi:exosome complex component RRP42-like [Anneissia japonica]|uniref:exosome complex component RRP42-like n=1 Tax=Anneissia japonica TaxID=1529436 RepID=UPI0014256A8B|nr:exosome complex component RRP42-like [Anneissia japonica]
MASVSLSEAEKTFIIHGIQDDLRCDGRECETYRLIELECGLVSNCSGSAKLKLSNTDILVGIKAEMGTPKTYLPDKGYMEFFVDCSATASPKFDGRGGEDLASEIATTMSRMYGSAETLNLEDLCILPGECCWVLYVDVVVLECGGNLFDAVSLCIKAALADARIPKVTVQMDDEGNQEMDVSDDPHDCYRFKPEMMPLLVTVNKVNQKHIIDATIEEEACSLACIMISVMPKTGKITSIVKKGSGSLDPDSTTDMIQCGKRVADLLHSNLMDTLNAIEKSGSKVEKVGFLA